LAERYANANETLEEKPRGATAGLSSSVARGGGSTLLDEPAVAPNAESALGVVLLQVVSALSLKLTLCLGKVALG